jgi:hypothetical protein
VVFLDDILIFSKDASLHAAHLDKVLGILQAHNYFASLHKCTFAEPALEFLRHVISFNTIVMDPTKIQAVLDWPTPTTVRPSNKRVTTAPSLQILHNSLLPSQISPAMRSTTSRNIGTQRAQRHSHPSRQQSRQLPVSPCQISPYSSWCTLTHPALPWGPSFSNNRHQAVLHIPFVFSP